MSVARFFMMLGLTLPLVGLVYGMSSLNGGDPKFAMFTELSCLAAGVLIFVTARAVEKKRSP